MILLASVLILNVRCVMEVGMSTMMIEGTTLDLPEYFTHCDQDDNAIFDGD